MTVGLLGSGHVLDEGDLPSVRQALRRCGHYNVDDVVKSGTAFDDVCKRFNFTTVRRASLWRNICLARAEREAPGSEKRKTWLNMANIAASIRRESLSLEERFWL